MNGQPRKWESRERIDRSIKTLAAELASTEPERWRKAAAKMVSRWQTGPYSGFFYGRTGKLKEAYDERYGTLVAYFPVRPHYFYDPGPAATAEQQAKAGRLEAARKSLCELLLLLPPFADADWSSGQLRRQRMELLRHSVDYLELVEAGVPRRMRALAEGSDKSDTKFVLERSKISERAAFLSEFTKASKLGEKGKICEKYAPNLNSTPENLRRYGNRVVGRDNR